MEEFTIQVCCRIRPAHKKELDVPGAYNLLEVDNQNKVIRMPRVGKEYTFDQVFTSASQTQDVYEYGVKSLLDRAFQGYNSTFMCYGHTGTGKTFTMSAHVPQLATAASPQPTFGIIAHALHHALLQAGTQYTIQITYVQMYRDAVQDLLHPDSLRGSLKTIKDITRDPTDSRTVVPELTVSTPITNLQKFVELYSAADVHRVVATTQMNSTSSRGHSILTMIITNTDTGSQGRMMFVDLAGYERIKQTQLTDPLRLDEARHINLSLTALATVINSLTFKSSYVPYRNSKLTRMLQDCVGGNSKTMVLLTLGPSSAHVTDTVNTLHFGMNALQCKTTVVADVGPIDHKKECLRLQKLVQSLEERIEQMEKTGQKNATTLELSLQDEQRRTEELQMQIECLEQELSRVQDVERDFAKQLDDMRQQKEAVQEAYREALLELESHRKSAAIMTGVHKNAIEVQNIEDSVQDGKQENKSGSAPTVTLTLPPRPPSMSQSPPQPSDNVSSTTGSDSEPPGSPTSTMASPKSQQRSSKAGSSTENSDSSSDDSSSSGDSDSNSDSSDSDSSEDEIQLRWDMFNSHESYLDWIGAIQAAKGNITETLVSLADVASFFEYHMSTNAKPGEQGNRPIHCFAPHTTFCTGLPPSCFSGDLHSLNTFFKGGSQVATVTGLRFTCRGNNAFEGETLTIKATYDSRDKEGESKRRWFKIHFENTTPHMEIIAQDTLTYTVKSSDLGSYIAFEYVPVTSTNQIGTSSTIRTPTPIRPCIPSIANLRISGDFVCGGRVVPSYNFQEGTEGTPVVKWFSSVDGHSFSAPLPSLNDGYLSITADQVHHYVRVQVTPVRGADGARGNAVMSKLVYINIPEAMDSAVVSNVVAGSLTMREDKQLLKIDSAHITFEIVGGKSSKHKIKDILLACLPNSDTGIRIIHRNGKKPPVVSSLTAPSVFERDVVVLTYRAFFALQNGKVCAAALGADGAKQWVNGSWSSSLDAPAKRNIIYQQCHVVGRDLGKGFTRPGCHMTFLHFVEELLMYDVYDTLMANQNLASSPRAVSASSPRSRNRGGFFSKRDKKEAKDAGAINAVTIQKMLPYA